MNRQNKTCNFQQIWNTDFAEKLYLFFVCQYVHLNEFFSNISKHCVFIVEFISINNESIFFHDICESIKGYVLLQTQNTEVIKRREIRVKRFL